MEWQLLAVEVLAVDAIGPFCRGQYGFSGLDATAVDVSVDTFSVVSQGVDQLLQIACDRFARSMALQSNSPAIVSAYCEALVARAMLTVPQLVSASVDVAPDGVDAAAGVDSVVAEENLVAAQGAVGGEGNGGDEHGDGQVPDGGGVDKVRVMPTVVRVSLHSRHTVVSHAMEVCDLMTSAMLQVGREIPTRAVELYKTAARYGRRRRVAVVAVLLNCRCQ